MANKTKTNAWTLDWVDAGNNKSKGKPAKKFSWHPDSNQLQIVEAAQRDTNDHCSYCDLFIPAPRTVDHFVPKSVNRGLAYDWNNLYLSCGDCQKRNNSYDPLLIRPNEEGYFFDDFFYRDHEQNLRALDGPNRARAEKTIELFQLNKEGRRLQHKRRHAMQTRELTLFHERDFRYMFPEDDPRKQLQPSVPS